MCPWRPLSSGKLTWALWSLFSCSCLACLRAALWTRRVIFASRSSSWSSRSLWNMASFTLKLDGSFGWTRTPKTSVGQEDDPSESWGETLSFTERLWNNTNNSVFITLQEFARASDDYQTSTVTLSSHNICLYLDGVRSFKSQSMRNIHRLRRMKKKHEGQKQSNKLSTQVQVGLDEF